MSHLISREQCPQCAMLGADRSKDNLAIYSDGHKHCYACGYYVPADGISRFKGKLIEVSNSPAPINLPSDVSTDFPHNALSWLHKYEFTHNEIMKNHIMWSDYWSRVIFPFFDETGLIAWQGRYIPNGNNNVALNGKAPAKWFSQGKIHDIIIPLGIKNRSAILVENIISAHLVSRVGHGAIPLFGSNTNIKHLLRLSKLVDTIYVWLDPDKRSESVKIASMGKLLGLNSSVIWTDKKPHQYSKEEIQNAISKNI